ncbi:MAG: cation:dicarboxylase symporter family transporter [Desulfotomaculum sp.]|nr:cation:dicarboxylase symporter family transporter [Desulfotomaculum sp.]
MLKNWAVWLVFTSVNLPLEGIALVAGVDRVLDMARTSLNVIGDAVASLVVSKMEGELGETKLDGDLSERAAA